MMTRLTKSIFFRLHRVVLLSVNTSNRSCPWQTLRCVHRSATTPVHSPSHKHVEKGEDLRHVRNIGIMAHIDAGKTTTTERMLYYAGFTRHLGDVDDGDTVMDYMEQERVRGITITSAAITFPWKQHKINLIDTPGHVDFTIEVERALRVLDGAVAILDASAGVEAQTLTVWRQADHYSIPRIIYLNKMDKPRAQLEQCLQSIRTKLKVSPLLMHHPLGSGKDFYGIVDLVTLEKFTWKSDSAADGKNFQVSQIKQSEEPDLWEEVMSKRSTLIGQLSDLDEKIADLVLSDVKIDTFPTGDLIDTIRRVTLSQKLVPVFLGSSLKNKGVQLLLDGVTHYLPCPLDITHSFMQYYKNELCALAFKIIHTKQRGALTFIRLYSGVLRSGANIYNINRDCTEKPSRLLEVYADHYKDASAVQAGNIVCLTGLKQTITGDTLVSNASVANTARQLYQKSHTLSTGQQDDANNSNMTPMDNDVGDYDEQVSQFSLMDDSPVLAGLSVPDPVFLCSIEAPSQNQQKALENAIACLQREDPTFHSRFDEDTGQLIIAGMGELHMDVIRDRIHKEYGVEAELGPLQVSYREAITEPVRHTEVLDKTLSDNHHHVHITLTLTPTGTTDLFQGVQIEHSRTENLANLKRHHLKAINTGVRSALTHGPLLNFPVLGAGVCLHEFHMGLRTSLPMVIACASQAVAKSLRESKAILLEPMMQLEINTSEDHLHSVLGDLSQRRSHINNVHARDDTRLILALTPLAEMMGYATMLRTITSGTATFSMELVHYEKMTIQEQGKAVQRATGFAPIR